MLPPCLAHLTLGVGPTLQTPQQPSIALYHFMLAAKYLHRSKEKNQDLIAILPCMNATFHMQAHNTCTHLLSTFWALFGSQKMLLWNTATG